MTKQVTIHSIYGNYTIRFLPQYMQYFFTSHTFEQTVLLCPPPTPQSNTLQLFMVCFQQCAMFSTIQTAYCKCRSLLVS